MSLGSVSFLFIFFVTALRNMDAALEEAAAASGAGPMRTAVTITMPMIAPIVLGASFFSFIRAMDAFEVPVLLGLPAKVFVFGNRIYAAIEYDFPVNYGLATALGATFFVLMLGLLRVQHKLLKGKEFFVITGKGYKPQVVAPWPLQVYNLCCLYRLLYRRHRTAVVSSCVRIVSASLRHDPMGHVDAGKLHNHRHRSLSLA